MKRASLLLTVIVLTAVLLPLAKANESPGRGGLRVTAGTGMLRLTRLQ
ncbi:hypothetical protein X802_07695 [Thermococcus guaymasensis DSM 11113]|uniref:Uncharacterized protein n=1 Tax=Thermococcus guaymasensis DSM 11113 TaxID=1432656 RepID=A0A0X1KNG0_9EURY|nr:hypothetical protein X802_07695 [Thermococcus guaymasensis DSM 11113]